MKNVIVQLVTLSVMLSLVGGCSSNTQNENTGVGLATGAVAGGLLGSAIGGGTGKAVAIGVGIVAGALIGGSIGHSMDSSDNSHVTYALSSGAPATWTNRRSNTTYTVTPSRNYVTYRGNSRCRDYTTTAYINGQTQTVQGVACLRSDGRWYAVN